MTLVSVRQVVPFSPPDITELEVEAVAAVLRSGWITTGPQVAAFERELADYCGTDRAVALASATAGLELTLRLLGIGPGDEVITSAYTFTATAAVIDHVGATVVLVDTEPESFFMDLAQVERAITERTKAVIPIDIGGVMADYSAFRQIVEEARGRFSPASEMQGRLGRIAIVSDAAHSIGATRHGLRSGQAADFTSFSFHAVKNLTTAEGGAVTWNSALGVPPEEIHRRFMSMAMHGQTKSALQKTAAGGWEYDITTLGYKHNMTDIMAALGRSQLRRYAAMVDRRHELIQRYDETCGALGLRTLEHAGDSFRSSGHLYPVVLPVDCPITRDQLIEEMARWGVACNVHYKPLPLLSAYRSLGFRDVDFPRAMSTYSREVTLPLFSTMTDAQQAYVCDCLADLL
jgi:dTDP-4-amino-4,6-dideoxygalactose transaminase